MRTSAKWSIGFAALSIGSAILGVVTSPKYTSRSGEKWVLSDENPFWNFFAGLSWIGFYGAIICLGIFVFRALMDRSITRHEYHGPVDKSQHRAGDFAVISSGGSEVDQSGASSAQDKSIVILGEITEALENIVGFLASDNELSDSQKNYGTLLVEKIRDEYEPGKNQSSNLFKNIKELKQLMDSAVGAGESVKKAIALISSIV